MNNNLNILFVDDEEILLGLYKDWSESLGHALFFAPDGNFAVDLLNQHHIDIVLTDIKMPNMDGIQLLKHIKENFPAVDVIVCTGYSDSFHMEDALNAGAIDYIAKPFAFSELKLKLKRVMRERELIQHLNTEIKLSEERQTRLEMTQYALDMAADAIYWLTEDGKFTYANQSAARQMGYSVDELLTMSIFDINPFFPVEAWRGHWQELQEKGSIVLESIHRTKDGQDFPVEISANYNLFNSTVYNFAFVRDISKRKKIEQELINAHDGLEKLVGKKTKNLQQVVKFLEKEIKRRSESEELLAKSELLFKTLFEEAGDYIFILDIEAEVPIILDANQACCDILGYKREELIGQPVSFTEPEVHQKQVPGLLKMAKTGAIATFETCHITKDGRIFPAEVTTKMVRVAGKNICFSIERNITARKKADKKIRSLSTRLGNIVEEERKNIAADLHDEFGQLLLSLNYKIYAIKEKASSTCRNLIQEDFTTLDNISQQLADCCRDITSRLRPPILDNKGFIPALQWTVDNFREIQKNDLTVSFKISAPIPTMSEYIKIVIYRVLQESLNNIAKHASPKNVSITLELEALDIILTIKDDGTGFDTATTNCHTAEDRGFGLQGMQERLSSLAGDLVVYSQPGKGTTIAAIIPLEAIL